jgi:hypothetical protein
MPSNLRPIQFLNVGFRKKIRNMHIPRIFDAPLFFDGGKMCLTFKVIQYLCWFSPLHSIRSLNMHAINNRTLFLIKVKNAMPSEAQVLGTAQQTVSTNNMYIWSE